ncbi:MAG TPA: hypothetical protein VK438_11895 [Xanthobacteraceae bacterium]|nr:hypothetical protein [Xanthobacteraceae bacterium]
MITLLLASTLMWPIDAGASSERSRSIHLVLSAKAKKAKKGKRSPCRADHPPSYCKMFE